MVWKNGCDWTHISLEETLVDYKSGIGCCGRKTKPKRNRELRQKKKNVENRDGFEA